MPSTRPSECEPLVFPLPSSPSRIAIIGGRFSEAKNTRDFDVEDIYGLCEWDPEALVAPLEHALTLAEFAPPLELSAAIVVLSSLGGPLLDAHARDVLWEAFGVPVFEQLRSLSGSVIARECEAHAGLHIARESLILERDTAGEIRLRSGTGLIGEIVECECECGSGIPRLRNLAAVADLAAAGD